MDQDMDMTNITPINEDKKKEKEAAERTQSNSIIKLVSSDGKSFNLDYDCVIQSETIKDLLESNPSKRRYVDWLENKTGMVEFPCIDSKVLNKVVEYMLYKKMHADELVEEFFIEPEMALDMMLAADYLDL